MSDEVSRNTIWKEHSVKDQKHATLNTTFCIGDPRKSVRPPLHMMFESFSARPDV